MAPRKRKKKPLVKFELSLWGLFAIGIACFCIFLWMFILGVWAGQSLLVTGSQNETAAAFLEVATLFRPE